MPLPGIVVDRAVLQPFALDGLGLIPTTPAAHTIAALPILGRLAIDISNPHTVAITYRQHPDDAETPLAQHTFPDPHTHHWTTALAAHDRILLTVTTGPPPPTLTASALHSTWAAIIGCSPDCVDRTGPPPQACDRHRIHLPTTARTAPTPATLQHLRATKIAIPPNGLTYLT